jgi:hypothetical protein
MDNHFGIALAVFSLMCLFYFHYLYRQTLERNVKKVREARREALEEMERIKASQGFERKMDAFTQAIVSWKYGDLSHADRARLVSIVRRQSMRRNAGGH